MPALTVTTPRPLPACGTGQPLHRGPHPLDGHRARRQRLFGEDAQELFPAIAVERVPAADLGLELGGHGPQDLVARRVPVGVVVGLEVIDVEQSHAVAVAVTGHSGLQQRKILLEGPPVPQARERVPTGDDDERVVQGLQFGPLPGQLVMEGGDPGGGDQAGPEAVGVERLEEVVIGPGLHSFEDLRQ